MRKVQKRAWPAGQQGVCVKLFYASAAVRLAMLRRLLVTGQCVDCVFPWCCVVGVAVEAGKLAQRCQCPAHIVRRMLEHKVNNASRRQPSVMSSNLRAEACVEGVLYGQLH